MAEIVAKKYTNVSASSFKGLTVDFAKANSINFILRGMRDSSDFDNEAQNALITPLSSFHMHNEHRVLSKWIERIKNGENTLQFRQAIAEAMTEEMRRDETIYLMGEEVAEYNGAYKASKGMLDEFGELRVIDTPISEAGFSGVGVGSTMVGARPIIEFMTFNFALVGIDQIINNAAKIRQMSGGQFPCPIVFRGPTASAGQLGATHSQAFESWFANCPGLKVSNSIKSL